VQRVIVAPDHTQHAHTWKDSSVPGTGLTQTSTGQYTIFIRDIQVPAGFKPAISAANSHTPPP